MTSPGTVCWKAQRVLSAVHAQLGCLRRMKDEDLTIIGRRIGYSDSIADVFGIARIDRRRHLYVQGKTGSGKSTLLKAMLAQDLARGEGVCFIDPLGHNAVYGRSPPCKGFLGEPRQTGANCSRVSGLGRSVGRWP